MTPPDKLLELAARVEAATGPDHLLDRDIAMVMGLDWPNRGPFAKGYTASLDAALTLYVSVPERVPSNPRLATAEALRQRAEAENAAD